MSEADKKWRIELAARCFSYAQIGGASQGSLASDAFDVVETLIVEADKRYDRKPEHVTEQATQPLVKHWTDPETGFVWHVEPDWRGPFTEALVKFGDNLPTLKEVEAFESHKGMAALEAESGYFWAKESPDSGLDEFHAVFLSQRRRGTDKNPYRFVMGCSALLVERK